MTDINRALELADKLEFGDKTDKVYVAQLEEIVAILKDVAEERKAYYVIVDTLGNAQVYEDKVLAFKSKEIAIKQRQQIVSWLDAHGFKGWERGLFIKEYTLMNASYTKDDLYFSDEVIGTNERKVK